MSIGQGLPNYLTSVGNIGTRVKGPALSGEAQQVSGGPLPHAGGFICIQSTASLLNQVVSTANAVIANRASFVYIPVTTGPLVGASAPPYVGVGTPLVWDDANKRLAIWSSGSSSWLATLSSVGGAQFTSS
jgi:hypothetical protein